MAVKIANRNLTKRFLSKMISLTFNISLFSFRSWSRDKEAKIVRYVENNPHLTNFENFSHVTLAEIGKSEL